MHEKGCQIFKYKMFLGAVKSSCVTTVLVALVLSSQTPCSATTAVIPRRPTPPALASLPEADEDDDQQNQEDIITAGFRGTAAAFQRIPASGTGTGGAAASAENLAPAGADADVPLRGDTPGLLRSMSAKLGQVRTLCVCSFCCLQSWAKRGWFCCRKAGPGKNVQCGDGNFLT
jgi:hypothetical protein